MNSTWASAFAAAMVQERIALSILHHVSDQGMLLLIKNIVLKEHPSNTIGGEHDFFNNFCKFEKICKAFRFSDF